MPVHTTTNAAIARPKRLTLAAFATLLALLLLPVPKANLPSYVRKRDSRDV